MAPSARSVLHRFTWVYNNDRPHKKGTELFAVTSLDRESMALAQGVTHTTPRAGAGTKQSALIWMNAVSVPTCSALGLRDLRQHPPRYLATSPLGGGAHRSSSFEGFPVHVRTECDDVRMGVQCSQLGELLERLGRSQPDRDQVWSICIVIGENVRTGITPARVEMGTRHPMRRAICPSR